MFMFKYYKKVNCIVKKSVVVYNYFKYLFENWKGSGKHFNHVLLSDIKIGISLKSKLYNLQLNYIFITYKFIELC